MFNRRYLYILLGCFAVAAPLGYLVGVHWLEGFAVRTSISPLLFLVSFSYRLTVFKNWVRRFERTNSC